MSLGEFNQQVGDPQMILPLWEARKGQGKQTSIQLIPGDIPPADRMCHSLKVQDGFRKKGLDC